MNSHEPVGVPGSESLPLTSGRDENAESSDRLPNLLIVGVPKAGTGSLFSYLKQHPDICGSTIKEVGFFTHLLEGSSLPDLDSYRSNFTHCQEQKYLLEATPGYCLGGQLLAEAVRDTLPAVRLVLILRDPVDRLWSAFNFQRSWGRLGSVATFEEYVRECEEQRRRGHNVIRRGSFNGLSIGFYAEYLGPWLEIYGESIKVVFFDDFKDRGAAVIVEELCRWLSIDPELAPSLDYRTHNKTVPPRRAWAAQVMGAVKKTADAKFDLSPSLRSAARRLYFRLNSGQAPEPMSAEMKQYLRELYTESNVQIARMLKSKGYVNLPAWL